LAVFTQSTARFCENLTITLVFEKNANFFRRKFTKIISKNCDHDIDPWGRFYETLMDKIYRKKLLLGVSDPLRLSSSALNFSDYSFFVHHPVNRDDRNLLAHAMASD
jgi:hypothetical protein